MSKRLIPLFLLLSSALTILAQAFQQIPSARTSISAGGVSSCPQFNQAGSRILFLSEANNLVQNDDRGTALDLFVRDLVTQTTQLVSVGTNGQGGASENITSAVFSPDGDWVAFATEATNLVAEAPAQKGAIYLRQLSTGSTRRVIAGSNAICSYINKVIPFSNLGFSGNGRFIVFQSFATGFVTNTEGYGEGVFVHDLTNAQTTLLSASTSFWNCIEFYIPTSFSPSINGDGNRVAFVTSQRLYCNPDRSGDIYVRDLTTQKTIWASSNLTTFLATGLRSLARTPPSARMAVS